MLWQCYAADLLQLLHGDDGCADVFHCVGINGETSAQPQRNIGAVRRACGAGARPLPAPSSQQNLGRNGPVL